MSFAFDCHFVSQASPEFHHCIWELEVSIWETPNQYLGLDLLFLHEVLKPE